MRISNFFSLSSSTRRAIKIAAATLVTAAALAYPASSQAQVNLTSGAPTYTQNFNGLGTGNVSWTDNTSLVGWYLRAESTNPTYTVTAGNGGGTTGSFYNYGTTLAADRSLGTLPDGTTNDLGSGLRLHNNGTNSITSFSITYTGEQWRDANFLPQVLSFFSKTSASTITSLTGPEVADPAANGFTAFTALDFYAPKTSATGTLNGNNSTNRQTLGPTTLTATVPPGGEIMLLWKNNNSLFADHGLAIDDLTVTATFSGDTTAPTVSSIDRLTPAGATTNASTVTYRVTFSENIDDSTLSLADFTATTVSGTATGVSVASFATGTANDNVVDVTFNTGTGDKVLRLDILGAATITDLAGNDITASFTTGQTYTIDQTAPTVTSSNRQTPAGATTNAATVTFRVTFSENVDDTTISAADFTATTVSGDSTGVSVASISTGTANDNVFDVTVNTGTGDKVLRLDILGAATITDSAGNDITASFTTGQTYTVDHTAPTVTSINRLTPAGATTNAATVTFRVTFSESIDDSTLANADFTATTVSGSATGVSIASFATGTANDNVVDVTVNTGTGDKVLRLDILAAASINDTAGNDITASFTTGQTYTVDHTAPTVTSINRLTPAGATTNASTVTFRVTFSESIDDSTLANADFTATTVSGTATGVSIASFATGTANDNVVDVTVNTGTGDKVLRLDILAAASINDTAGNDITASFTTGETYTIDHTAPTVSSINRLTPAGATTNASTVTFRVTFSESIDDSTLANADFTATTVSGTATGVSIASFATGTANDNVVDVTVNSGTGDKVLRLDILAAATITDIAGNDITTSFTTGQTYTIDQTAPTVSSINRLTPAGATTNASTVTFRVTFSESIDDSTLANADFTATTVSGDSTGVSIASFATGTANDNVVDVTVNTGTGDKVLRLDILGAATITDSAGNDITASFTTGQTYTVDHTAPTVTSINRLTPAGATTNASTVTFRVTFSESIDDSTLANADFTATTVSGSATGVSIASFATGTANDNVVDVTVNTGTGDKQLRLDILGAATINDTVGNDITASFTTGQTYDVDHTAPTVSSINRLTPAGAATNASTVTFRVTFSESIDDSTLANADFTATTVSGTATGVSIASFATGTANDNVVDVTVNTGTGDKVLRLDILAAATINDVAGNDITASFTTGETYTIDHTAPTVTSSNRQAPVSATTNASTVTFRVTFSESIDDSTLANADFTATTVSGDSTGVSIASFATGTANDNVVDVTVNTGTGDKQLRLDVLGAATISDLVGNDITASFTTGQTYDIIHSGPTVTVDFLTTNDTTPALTGTVSDAAATISVTVDSQTFAGVNNGSTWSATVPVALLEGTYDVAVTATDVATNVGSDGTINELVIDTTAPIVTVDFLTTNNTTPALSGTVDDATATVSVTVDSQTFAGVNNGSTWSATVPAALLEGTYDVAVTATDAASNVGSDATTDELIIDTTAPVVTVDNLTTNDTTPALTGSVDDATATISVTVDSQTFAGVNNGSTWSATVPAALLEGTYDVAVTATDVATNAGSDATTNELIIDTTVPVVTVDFLTTNDTTPALSGSVDDATTTITVTVDSQTFAGVNNGSTWSATVPAALLEGTYDVAVTATDAASNAGSDATTDELVVDTTAPVVTVDSLTTNDTTPGLSGTVNDPTATISVTVDSQTFAGVNNGSTWSATVPAALLEGTYDVAVTATDAAANVGSDATTDELVIDTTAPVVTVDSLTTNDTTPELSGTVNDPTATISVTVDSQTFAGVNNGSTWSATVPAALLEGTYDVAVTATDAASNVGSDATTNELVIDTTAPVVTVDSLTTNDTTPALSGSVDDATATISVTVDSQTFASVNNGSTWSATVPAALLEGTYDVSVTATDAASNAGSDATTDELVIDTTAPVVTVDFLTTNDTTPALTGTVDDATTTISVTVDSQTFAGVNNGSTWSATVPSALLEGTYDVAVTATDAASNVGSDATTNELVIDTTAPVVTVDFLTTNDTTPALTGSVDDATTSISVTVDSQTFAGVNNGSTWSATVPAALLEGTYDVSVTATDAATNAGSDATTNELVIDTTAPTVTSSDRLTPAGATTNAATVTFRVTFSESIDDSTLSNADFTATTVSGDSTGVSVASLATGTSNDNVVDVTVNTGTGDKQLRLDILGAATINDLVGNDLTASFTTGQPYNVDHTAPTVTVDSLTTNDTTPALSGTVNDATATISVTVDSQTFAGVNNGSTWSATVPAALLAGTYDVSVTATDAATNAGSDATTNELVIDTTAPTVTSSNRLTPAGSATNAATVTFRVTFSKSIDDSSLANADFTATTVSGDSTSVSVASFATGTANDNVVDVTVNTGTGDKQLRLDVLGAATINDLVGNDITASFTTGQTYDVDHTAPTVTSINRLTPAGATTNASTVTFRVTFSESIDDSTVANSTSTATTVSGTATGVSVASFATGTANDNVVDVTVNTGTGDKQLRLDVLGAVTINDLVGNGLTASFTTGQTYDVDHTAPTVTVDSLTTNDTTPALTGTMDDATATISVTVDSQTFAGVNNGSTWSATVPAALLGGTYDVSVTATDTATNAGSDATTNELVIDATAPTVTSSNRLTPAGSLTNAATVTFRVTFSKNIDDSTLSNADFTAAAVSGDATGVSVASFATGTANDNVVDVTVNTGTGDKQLRLDVLGAATISDLVGNDIAASFTTGQTYDVDHTAPVVTVDSLTTSDTTPALSGTVDDASTSISVTVDSQTFAGVNNGSTWSATVPVALLAGTYDVAVTATDAASNAGSDATTDELVIDTGIVPESNDFSNWEVGGGGLLALIPGSGSAYSQLPASGGNAGNFAGFSTVPVLDFPTDIPGTADPFDTNPGVNRLTIAGTTSLTLNASSNAQGFIRFARNPPANVAANSLLRFRLKIESASNTAASKDDFRIGLGSLKTGIATSFYSAAVCRIFDTVTAPNGTPETKFWNPPAAPGDDFDAYLIAEAADNSAAFPLFFDLFPTDAPASGTGNDLKLTSWSLSSVDMGTNRANLTGKAVLLNRGNPSVPTPDANETLTPEAGAAAFTTGNSAGDSNGAGGTSNSTISNTAVVQTITGNSLQYNLTGASVPSGATTFYPDYSQFSFFTDVAAGWLDIDHPTGGHYRVTNGKLYITDVWASSSTTSSTDLPQLRIDQSLGSLQIGLTSHFIQPFAPFNTGSEITVAPKAYSNAVRAELGPSVTTCPGFISVEFLQPSLATMSTNANVTIHRITVTEFNAP